MLVGACDCGAVRVEIDAESLPSVWRCDCAICHKLGALWTYHQGTDVRVLGDATAIYLRAERVLEFHRCTVCGCTTHWIGVGRRDGRMGVNARMLDPKVLRRARVEGPGI